MGDRESMVADINQDGLGALGCVIKDLDLNIILGDKKTGFLKREKVATVTTGHPAVEVKVNEFAVVDDSKNPWLYVGLGAGGTAALAIALTLLLSQ
jgi:hypothetical protein